MSIEQCHYRVVECCVGLTLYYLEYSICNILKVRISYKLSVFCIIISDEHCVQWI